MGYRRQGLLGTNGKDLFQSLTDTLSIQISIVYKEPEKKAEKDSLQEQIAKFEIRIKELDLQLEEVRSTIQKSIAREKEAQQFDDKMSALLTRIRPRNLTKEIQEAHSTTSRPQTTGSGAADAREQPRHSSTQPASDPLRPLGSEPIQWASGRPIEEAAEGHRARPTPEVLTISVNISFNIFILYYYYHYYYYYLSVDRRMLSQICMRYSL